MGKVDRRPNKVEPFVTLFCALVIVLANTWPCPPVRHLSTALHKACPYMVIVGSILRVDALPPPLYLSRMLAIYDIITVGAVKLDASYNRYW